MNDHEQTGGIAVVNPPTTEPQPPVDLSDRVHQEATRIAERHFTPHQTDTHLNYSKSSGVPPAEVGSATAAVSEPDPNEEYFKIRQVALGFEGRMHDQDGPENRRIRRERENYFKKLIAEHPVSEDNQPSAVLRQLAVDNEAFRNFYIKHLGDRWHKSDPNDLTVIERQTQLYRELLEEAHAGDETYKKERLTANVAAKKRTLKRQLYNELKKSHPEQAQALLDTDDYLKDYVTGAKKKKKPEAELVTPTETNGPTGVFTTSNERDAVPTPSDALKSEPLPAPESVVTPKEPGDLAALQAKTEAIQAEQMEYIEEQRRRQKEFIQNRLHHTEAGKAVDTVAQDEAKRKQEEALAQGDIRAENFVVTQERLAQETVESAAQSAAAVAGVLPYHSTPGMLHAADSALSGGLGVIPHETTPIPPGMIPTAPASTSESTVLDMPEPKGREKDDEVSSGASAVLASSPATNSEPLSDTVTALRDEKRDVPATPAVSRRLEGDFSHPSLENLNPLERRIVEGVDAKLKKAAEEERDSRWKKVRLAIPIVLVLLLQRDMKQAVDGTLPVPTPVPAGPVPTFVEGEVAPLQSEFPTSPAVSEEQAQDTQLPPQQPLTTELVQKDGASDVMLGMSDNKPSPEISPSPADAIQPTPDIHLPQPSDEMDEPTSPTSEGGSQLEPLENETSVPEQTDGEIIDELLAIATWRLTIDKPGDSISQSMQDEHGVSFEEYNDKYYNDYQVTSSDVFHNWDELITAWGGEDKMPISEEEYIKLWASANGGNVEDQEKLRELNKQLLDMQQLGQHPEEFRDASGAKKYNDILYQRYQKSPDDFVELVDQLHREKSRQGEEGVVPADQAGSGEHQVGGDELSTIQPPASTTSLTTGDGTGITPAQPEVTDQVSSGVGVTGDSAEEIQPAKQEPRVPWWMRPFWRNKQS